MLTGVDDDDGPAGHHVGVDAKRLRRRCTQNTERNCGSQHDERTFFEDAVERDCAPLRHPLATPPVVVQIGSAAWDASLDLGTAWKVVYRKHDDATNRDRHEGVSCREVCVEHPCFGHSVLTQDGDGNHEQKRAAKDKRKLDAQ